MDKCSLNSYFEGECDICNKFPNEEALVKLRECNKVISGHLRQCKLAEKSFPSDAELLSCRAGIWKWKKETDRGTTVCPFHRYNYGIGWRPSMKCGFPNHPVDSRCKPQRGMTAAMCEVAQLRWGFLCRVGTGICRQCMNDVLSEDKDPSFENSQLEKVDDHDDSCVSAKEVFNDEVLHGHSESTTYLDIDSEGDCFSQATNASNWSAEEGVNDLDNINHAVSLLSHGTTSPVRAQLSISLETAKESTIRYYKRQADEACNYFCELIAPTQGKKLKSLVSNDLSSNEDSSFDTLDNIKKLFENSNDSMVRTQILSVVVNQYSKAELLSLIPGLTKHQIDKARKHAFMFGPGKKDETAVSTTLHRQKMDRTKMTERPKRKRRRKSKSSSGSSSDHNDTTYDESDGHEGKSKFAKKSWE